MKKLFCIIAFVLGAVPLAQAQVYFEPGSVRPINPGAASRTLDRQEHVRQPVKLPRALVKCRDGSKHIARVCKRHGGVARQ